MNKRDTVNDLDKAMPYNVLLPDVGLIEEFAKCNSNLKAEIVYRKCLQNGKFELSGRIKQKYKLVDKHDDMVVALAFALQVNYS